MSDLNDPRPEIDPCAPAQGSPNQADPARPNKIQDDLSSSTLKIGMPGAAREDEMASLERDLDLKALNLESPPLPPLRGLPDPQKWAKYTLLGELRRDKGRIFYLAQDESVHRLMVMKILECTPNLEQDQMQRFLEEAQILAQMPHAALPPVYDIDIDRNGQLFFTMPYIPGSNLSEACSSPTGKKSERFRLLFLFLQVCGGIASAHAHGVCHRNLCPENIHVDASGAPYVLGWSSCRAKQGSEAFDRGANRQIRDSGKLVTTDGRLVGNMLYMAPELVADNIRHVDERADIYALGAILYYIMAGSHPFESSGFGHSFEKICAPERKIPRWKTRLPISRAAARIIAKAMDADRTRRHRSVAELSEDVVENILL